MSSFDKILECIDNNDYETLTEELNKNDKHIQIEHYEYMVKTPDGLGGTTSNCEVKLTENELSHVDSIFSYTPENGEIFNTLRQFVSNHDSEMYSMAAGNIFGGQYAYGTFIIEEWNIDKHNKHTSLKRKKILRFKMCLDDGEEDEYEFRDENEEKNDFSQPLFSTDDPEVVSAFNELCKALKQKK